MGKSKGIDWGKLSAHYRAGVRTLRDIASEFGTSEANIRKRAKAEEWPRDLSERIRAKADDLVRKAMVRNGAQGPNERDIEGANATISADIQLRERDDISKATGAVRQLWNELSDQLKNLPDLSKLGELMANPDLSFDKMNEAYYKTISFGGRVDSVKKLSDALKTLIELERKVWRVDAPEALDASKLTVVISKEDANL